MTLDLSGPYYYSDDEIIREQQKNCRHIFKVLDRIRRKRCIYCQVIKEDNNI